NVLEPHFLSHITRTPQGQHLDIGVGTGHYLALAARSRALRNVSSVTLFDLSPLTLSMAEERLRKAGYEGEIKVVQDEKHEPSQQTFNSISLFYLLHCLPGNMYTKSSKVFSSLKHRLSSPPSTPPQLDSDPNSLRHNGGGVLYGATVPGERYASHNWLGKMWLRYYNRQGVISNTEDSREGLEVALREHFGEVDIWEEGRVVLFVARRLIIQ
ncbi:hypothetical protein K474DRAFT_1609087, partial [Panus rudis PR-1116 ss-1]